MTLYKWLLRSAILPLGEKLRGTSILVQLETLEESQWWPPARLEALQIEQLQALLVHARQHVPRPTRGGLAVRGPFPPLAVGWL